MSAVLIEGMRETTSHAKALGGKLALPAWANRIKYAFKWAKEGLDVEAARQPQQITGSKYEVDGWEICKNAGQMCRRVLQDGRYILLCRPRGLQDAVNAECGNVSRSRILQEHSGKSRALPANEESPSSGMIPDEVLERLDPTPGEAEKLKLPFNQIKPASSSGTTKTKTTKNKN